MSLSFAALSATELALLAADKPILGSNAIPISPIPVFAWSDTGDWVSHVASGYPESRIYDGRGDLWTKPDQPLNTWMLQIDASAAPMEFDFLAIIGNNFATSLPTISLDISNTSNWSGALSIPIATPTTNARLLTLSLKHTGTAPLRYTGVPYARIVFTNAITMTPNVGEVIFGRRRQLAHRSDRPYDSLAQIGTATQLTTQGGILSKHAYAMGARKLRASWVEWETPYVTDLPAWWANIGYGARTFIWIEAPSSAPTSFNLMMPDSDDFNFPIEDCIERHFMLEGTEQGPQSYYLNRGIY